MPFYSPHPQQKDCGYCKPNVMKCFLILLMIWIVTMIILALNAQQWRPGYRPHHLIKPATHQHQKKTGGVDTVGTTNGDGNDDQQQHNTQQEEQQQHDGNNNDDTSDDSQSHVKIEKLDDAIAVARQAAADDTASSGNNRKEKLNCFAVVVSNEEYIDGTLVLGFSLRKFSKLAQTGKAELVVIVPENALSRDSIDRLHLAGWNHVLQVEDLAKKAPKAHWAGTFNKLYLFHLIQYSLVAFFDADMVIQHNPDYIFRKHLKNFQYIGALGNSLYDHNGKPRPAYFQTGMMLAIPSEEAYESMMHDFYHGRDSRGLNGRDGLIIRRYFGKNYQNLDDALSAHVGTSLDYDWVTGLHYRGGFKPWFNKLKAAPFDDQEIRRLKKKGKTDFGPPGKWLEIGPAYSIWWETYEEFHRSVMMDRDIKLMMKDATMKNNNNNHHDFPSGYDPKRHVWMNRHSKKKSYIQLLRSVAADERQEEIEINILSSSSKNHNNKNKQKEIKTIVGEAGQNCDSVCKSYANSDSESNSSNKWICNDKLLSSSRFLQSCDIIENKLKKECGGTKKKCQHFGGRPAASASQPDSISCTFNNMLNPFVVPLCNATPSVSSAKRICLCIIPPGGGENGMDNDENGHGNREAEGQHKNQKQHHGDDNSNEQHQDAEEEKENGDENNKSDHQENKKDSSRDEAEADEDEQANHHHQNSICSVGVSDSSSSSTSHPSSIKRACILRLKETKKHFGSWSLFSSSTEEEATSNDDSTGAEQKKEHGGSSMRSTLLLPILARFHDKFVETLWFPQRDAPFLIEKILFSHLLGRILALQWVPVSSILQLPLKSVPKALTKKLRLHDIDQKHHRHHHQSKQEIGEKKKVLEDIVDYLKPDGSCRDIVPSITNKNNNDDDNPSSWSVRVAVSARPNHHQSHQQQQSKMMALINENDPSQFAEAALLKFILGVSSTLNGGGGGSWESVIEHLDEIASKEKSRQLSTEIPRCSVLSKLDKFQKKSFFAKRNVKSPALLMLFGEIEAENDPSSDHIHSNNKRKNGSILNRTSNGATSSRKQRQIGGAPQKTGLEILHSFLTKLQSEISTTDEVDNDLHLILEKDFEVDVDTLRLKEDGIMNILIKALVADGNDGGGDTFAVFLRHVVQRVETLLSLVPRCTNLL